MAPSPTIRRLLKETSELSSTSKNPNPAFHAAPVSDTDLHEWHFTLLGPPSPSPYAGGLYHGRISLPPSYPLKPPNFRFLTPSGRFEVNREICLSISGFHEETWMPAWGVRTALTALRSFMAEKGTAGQVGGLEAPKEVRERLAKESRLWRCAECSARTNEEIMTDWWEACAQKGVKVGEDVGLEVLPEGLSLEAKTPGASTENKGKGKEETTHEKVVGNTTQSILHNSSQDGQQQTQVSAPAPSIPKTALQSPTSIAISSTQSQHPPHSTNSISSTLTGLDTSQSQTSHPQPTTSSSTNTSIPSGLRQLPRIPPPPGTAASATVVPSPTSSSPTQRHQSPTQTQTHPPARRRDEDQNTLTIDRAIYVVFAALFIMVMKKLFYPAKGAGSWEDFALVRE